MSARVPWGRVAGEAFFFAAAALAALDVAQLRRARVFEWSEVSARALAAGTAPTPFQYRALTGWLARLTSDPRCVEELGCSPEAAFRRLDVLAVLLLAYAFRAYMADLFEGDGGGRGRARLAAAVVTPAVILALPWQFMLNAWRQPTNKVIWFPWDLPAVLGFTACVRLLRAERWRWYYPAFALATLNKETTLFLVPVYLAARWGAAPRRALALHAGAQCALWLAVKLALRALYAGNRGGGLYEDHLLENALYLGEARNVLFVLGSFGFAWAPVAALAGRVPDRFARRALAVVPLWVAGMFAVGNLYELRVFGELAAVVLPAWLLLAREALRDADRPA